ncbi:MAG: nucleotidyltransferase domain-containing protein [Opitutaceae bacterium]|jgi:predicted nucleotidyltransferase|nr:nucleotidyltransferase domain-containing protein [Opitutaceae bacterium]
MKTVSATSSSSPGSKGKNISALRVSEIRRRLVPYCRTHGILRLEVFGSVARNEAKEDSDVDLLATFSGNPGLHFFSMEQEMGRTLGVPVHLLSRMSVEEMTNPFRRESILADARPIYDAREAG